MKEPKFKINQHVSNGTHCFFVHGVIVATQCFPDLQYEYFLGDKQAQTSATNEAPYRVSEKDIMTVEESCRIDLKEISHFYGGWDELKKVIQNLEDNDNEAAHERAMNDH